MNKKREIKKSLSIAWRHQKKVVEFILDAMRIAFYTKNSTLAFDGDNVE